MPDTYTGFLASVLAAEDLAAFVGVDLVAVFLAVLALLAVLRVAAAFAGAFFAVAVARAGAGAADFVAVRRGSFLTPEITFLNSWPGRNFGATDFFTLIV